MPDIPVACHWQAPPGDAAGFPAGLIITNSNGVIRWANDFALALTGRGSDLLAGQDVAAILTPSAQLLFEAQCWPLLAATGHVQEVMLELRSAEGPDIPILASMKARVEQGTTQYFITFLRAHDRRRHEALSRQARAMAEDMAKNRAEYFASLSHELRSPLNAIMGFADMIASQTAGPLGSPKYQDWSKGIIAGGKHLLDVINEVLDFAKAEQGMIRLDREEMALAPFLAEIQALAASLAVEKMVGLSFPDPASLPVQSLRADPYRLRQILLNLISNAIRFAPRQGQVCVILSATQDSLQLTVADDGPGIAADDLERVFEPYVQVGGRRRDGTGLGLPLARRLAQAHRGQLQLESTPGQGTRAVLTLPL